MNSIKTLQYNIKYWCTKLLTLKFKIKMAKVSKTNIEFKVESTKPQTASVSSDEGDLVAFIASKSPRTSCSDENDLEINKNEGEATKKLKQLVMKGAKTQILKTYNKVEAKDPKARQGTVHTKIKLNKDD